MICCALNQADMHRFAWPLFPPPHSRGERGDATASLDLAQAPDLDLKQLADAVHRGAGKHIH